MEQPMRCKTLTAIYKNEINTLKKLYEIDFLIHKSVRIHIEQFTVRKIEIDFTSEQLVDDLIAVLTKVERLLMLFDGYFMNLISIEFQDSAGCVPPNLKECAEHFMRRRLAYPKQRIGSRAYIGESMVKILICDDDPTFAQSMFKRILSLPAYSSKSMKLSCLTDIAEMSANTIAQYDILFLDIDLGKESGIDLARKMRKMNPEAVLIFVTNFSEYAPEGYEVDAFRYLAKSELEKKLPTYFEDALAMCRTRQRKVEILCEGESVPIPVQSLAWIESQGREQYLHLVGGCREQLITRLTMAQLEDLLVPHGFLRIHKSYLVNMAYLQSFQSTSAVLTIGQTLPVGARSYRDNKQKFVRWQAQQLW